jgi:hypothetical protein
MASRTRERTAINATIQKLLKEARDKEVEATQQEGFICIGGFSNPIF